MTDYGDLIEVTSLSDTTRTFIHRYTGEIISETVSITADIISPSAIIFHPAKTVFFILQKQLLNQLSKKNRCDYCGQNNRVESLCCEFCGGRL